MLNILNQTQGVSVDGNKALTKQPTPCRYKLCYSLGTSLFASNFGSTKKNSDDQAISGVSREGYPFLVLVDGFFGCDRQGVFDFVELQILPLLEPYQAELARAPKQADAHTKQLINHIFARKRAFLNKGIDFTLSLAITFALKDGTYAAGLGVGDIGLVLKSSSDRIQQLTYRTVVDSFKDGFDDFITRSPAKIQDVIERSSRFLVPVAPGDELLAYTYLPEILELENDRPLDADPNEPRRYGLNTDVLSLSPYIPLLHQVWNHAVTAHQQQLAERQTSDDAFKFGDDATFASIQFPNPLQHQQILQDNLVLELRTYHKKLDAQMPTSKTTSSVWQWFSQNPIELERKVVDYALAVLTGKSGISILTAKEKKQLAKTQLGQIIQAYQHWGVDLEVLQSSLQQPYVNNPLLYLPEITEHMMQYLPISDLARTARTCRFFHEASQRTLQRCYYPTPNKLSLTGGVRSWLKLAAVNPQLVAVGFTNGKLELWDIAKNDMVMARSLNVPIRSVMASQNRWLVLITKGTIINETSQNVKGNASLVRWDIEQRQAQILYQTPGGMRLIPGAPEGKALVATANEVMLWDIANATCEEQWASTLSVSNHCESFLETVPYITIDGQQLIGAEGSSLICWDLATDKRDSWQADEKGEIIKLLRLSSHAIISAASNDTIKVWDLNTQQCLTTMNHRHLSTMSLLEPQRLLTVGGSGNNATLKIWDTVTGACLKTLHTLGVTHELAPLNPRQFVNAEIYSMIESTDVHLWSFSTIPPQSLVDSKSVWPSRPGQ
jgi:hypothetical protein